MSRKLDFDHAFKVLILGDPAVGKSSIVQRFVHGKFSADYLMTIGMEPYSRYENIDGKRICYAIWDIAGSDNFKVMQSIYFQGAVGSILVFDITRRESFDNIGKWINDARKHAPAQLSILVGNKNDLDNQRQVSEEEGNEKAKKLKFTIYLETSALTGANVNSGINFLGAKLLDKYGST